MSKIILYHGTIANFNTVDLRYAKANKDFGRGFYLTTDFNQACTWAHRLKIKQLQRGYNLNGIVYGFSLDTQMFKSLNTHTFNGANKSWLDYIVYNRNRVNKEVNDYDIVIGKVADANAQVIIDNYILHKDFSDKAKEITIMKLKTNNLTNQYCFKTIKAINLLNSVVMQRKVI